MEIAISFVQWAGVFQSTLGPLRLFKGFVVPQGHNLTPLRLSLFWLFYERNIKKNIYKNRVVSKLFTWHVLFFSSKITKDIIPTLCSFVCFDRLKLWACVLDWFYLICMKFSFKFFNNIYNRYSSILVFDCFDIIEYLHV